MSLHDHTATLSRAERSTVTRDLLAGARDTRDAGRRTEILADVVVVNRRVADAVAMRYRDRGVDLEDLRQAAYEGLVKAVHGYDAGRAEDLLTFAVPTIRGEVRRHFRDRSWVVRPPRRLQELQALVAGTTEELVRVLAREPTPEEICAEAGISEADLAEVVAIRGCFNPVSLDQSLGLDGGSTLGDQLGEDGGWDAAEARCMLAGVLADLGSRDRAILDGLYFRQLTQHEVGQEVGMTQVQVSRALRRVLAALRRRLGEVTDEAS